MLWALQTDLEILSSFSTLWNRSKRFWDHHEKIAGRSIFSSFNAVKPTQKIQRAFQTNSRIPSSFSTLWNWRKRFWIHHKQIWGPIHLRLQRCEAGAGRFEDPIVLFDAIKPGATRIALRISRDYHRSAHYLLIIVNCVINSKQDEIFHFWCDCYFPPAQFFRYALTGNCDVVMSLLFVNEWCVSNNASGITWKIQEYIREEM